MDQNLRDFCERYIENIFGNLQLLTFAKVTLLVVQKKKEAQEILTLQTLTFVSNPLLGK